jgi:crotonobetainyl-CoA:carnitine CoA-transferase CaiB-like acyl-CoA transferase
MWVDDVEKGVREWSTGVERSELVARCQAAGVPSGEAFTALESIADEHYLARGFRVEIEQPGNLIPQVILDGPGFRGSLMAEPVIGPAPLVGEHTREVCRDLLGMAEDDIERLVAAGALEVTPPAT